MGKTIPPFRMVLERTVKEWEKYRRALRKEDQEAFDRLMDACRVRSSASGQVARPVPLEAMFMSILLEHQRRLDSIDEKLERVLKRRK